MRHCLSGLLPDHFTGLVGQSLSFEAAEDMQTGEAALVELELLEVNALRPPSEANNSRYRAQPFSLLFRSVHGDELPQGLVCLRHDHFEPDPLFIPRIVPPPGYPTDRIYYEATFA